MHSAVDHAQISVLGTRLLHPAVERLPKREQYLGFAKVGSQGSVDRYPARPHQPKCEHMLEILLDSKYSFIRLGNIPCRVAAARTRKYPPPSMFFQRQVGRFNDVRAGPGKILGETYCNTATNPLPLPLMTSSKVTFDPLFPVWLSTSALTIVFCASGSTRLPKASGLNLISSMCCTANSAIVVQQISVCDSDHGERFNLTP